MATNRFDPIPIYEQSARHHETERARLAERSRRVSWARVTLFLAGAAGLILAIPGGAHAGTLVGSAAACFVVFFALVYWHSRLDEAEQWHATVVRLNYDAISRVRRDWKRLPPVTIPPAGEGHPYEEDLDIIGPASLAQLLGWVGTTHGRRTLGAWLLGRAEPDEVARRQEAVRELAGMREYREDLAARGRLLDQDQDIDRFFSWAESTGWLHRRWWLVWTARLSALLAVLLVTLHWRGMLGPWWLIPLAVNLAVIALFEKRIHDTFTRAFSRHRSFQSHAALFARLCAPHFTSDKLRELQRELHASGLSVPREMAQLGTLMQLADLRFQAFFHFPINTLLLWDVQVLDRLERWQERTGPWLRRWFGVLGEADALAGMAALAHDNPDWAFPEVRAGLDRVSARDLGHPLLPSDRRVANDVEVGPRGTVLLVTGSNMSGKSTLLRSLGTNIVLAQAGAPVCATAMSLPPLQVYTSMRVHDSLEAGVSYFMAALQRLKVVVTAAKQVPEGAPGLIYLLDEVLQGTNTAERQVAVRRILDHLLALPVLGAVTTHDLELAKAPELAERAVTVHFTEGVEEHQGEARLVFDYRLRPGVATSRNALMLLRLVGLDER